MLKDFMAPLLTDEIPAILFYQLNDFFNFQDSKLYDVLLAIVYSERTNLLAVRIDYTTIIRLLRVKLIVLVRMRVLIENTINQLKDVQNSKNWMGASFVQKLNMVSEEEAFVRPTPNLHSVAEIISHLTAWRKDIVLKIEVGRGTLTDDSEENWLTNHILKKVGWNKIKAEYQDSLTAIIKLLQTKDDNFLDEKYYDNDFKDYYSYRFVIDGMLHHDIYHLGQLGIIMKLLKEPKTSSKPFL